MVYTFSDIVLEGGDYSNSLWGGRAILDYGRRPNQRLQFARIMQQISKVSIMSYIINCEHLPTQCVPFHEKPLSTQLHCTAPCSLVHVTFSLVILFAAGLSTLVSFSESTGNKQIQLLFYFRAISFQMAETIRAFKKYIIISFRICSKRLQKSLFLLDKATAGFQRKHQRF